MARLWSCGFELNSLTAGVEIATPSATPGSIVTSPVNGGTYAYRNNPSSSVQNIVHIFNTGTVKTLYGRLYFRATTFPTNGRTMFVFGNTGDTTDFYFASTGSGIRALDNTNTQVGSDIALNTGQWYRIEFKAVSSIASGTLDVLIDGVSKISVTGKNINNGNDFTQMTIGSTSSTSHDYYIDDIAVNDDTGSFQNSYPGVGNIIHLHPDSAGDSTQWVPDSGSNYARVNEVTPDDATSLVSDVVLNESDFYNCGASGIGASSVVNVVSVGVRFRNDVADVTTAFKVQIKKASGGTISQSTAITPNSTTWKTNATVSPFAYPITLYQDPDNSNWTQVTLDSMQIGQQSVLIGVNKNQVSTVWALVDYTPVTTKSSKMMLTGIS